MSRGITPYDIRNITEDVIGVTLDNRLLMDIFPPPLCMTAGGAEKWDAETNCSYYEEEFEVGNGRIPGTYRFAWTEKHYWCDEAETYVFEFETAKDLKDGLKELKKRRKNDAD